MKIHTANIHPDQAKHLFETPGEHPRNTSKTPPHQRKVKTPLEHLKQPQNSFDRSNTYTKTRPQPRIEKDVATGQTPAEKFAPILLCEAVELIWVRGLRGLSLANPCSRVWDEYIKNVGYVDV